MFSWSFRATISVADLLTGKGELCQTQWYLKGYRMSDNRYSVYCKWLMMMLAGICINCQQLTWMSERFPTFCSGPDLRH